MAPVLRPVRRAVGVVTPLGWSVLIAGAGATWAGRRFGWQELIVLGIVLLATVLLALLWILGRSNYQADLELTEQRVTVGQRAVGRVVLRNNAARPSWPVIVELPVGSAVAPFAVPSLRRGGEHEETFTVPTRRRGVITLGPVRSVRGDPLGLMRRVKRWNDPVELFVRPRTVRLQGATTGFLRDVEGVTTQDLSSSDVSFHALRDYVPGDDRRAVHWRSSARTGKLIVRQFEETRRAHLLLVLSVSENDYDDPADFETAVAVVASMAAQALAEQRQVSVVTQHGLIRYAGATHLLDLLCRVETAPELPGIVALTAAAIAEVPQASVAAVVAGAAVEPVDLRRAHSRIPLTVTSFALLARQHQGVQRHRIGHFLVLALGDVDDLRRALRAVA
jgi:uncharacterized protein (DUF58 family)